jgi:hypothetical protein
MAFVFVICFLAEGYKRSVSRRASLTGRDPFLTYTKRAQIRFRVFRYIRLRIPGGENGSETNCGGKTNVSITFGLI